MVVKTSVWCMCVLRVCMQCVYVQFVLTITCTFMHGFQNNLAQLFSLRSGSAIGNICSGRLKVKVTVEGQMI